MPRIELLSPKGHGRDGSPTIDVCCDCGKMFEEKEALSGEAANKVNENHDELTVDEDWVVGSTEVAHPPYSDDIYDCGCCGVELTEDDD